MNPILQAINSGYTTQQILGFVRKAFPSLAPKITQAVNAGHSLDKIVGFLTNIDGQKGLSNENASTILGRNNQADAEKAQGLVRGAAGLATSALGTYALGRALPSMFSGQTPTAGSVNPAGQPPVLPQGGIQNAPIPNPVAANNAAALPTNQPLPGSATAQPAANPALPVNAAPVLENAEKIIDDMKIRETVDNLSKTLPPEDVAAVLEQHMLSDSQKKWMKDNVKTPLPQLIDQYVKSMAGQSAKEPPTSLIQQLPEQPNQKVDLPLQSPPIKVSPSEDIEQPEVPKQEESAKQVMLPDGRIGSVVSEKSGILKIDDEGKTSHRKSDEVFEAPLPERDLADIYEELVGAIPEKERSAVINWAGYDPNTKELAFRPHNGALYVYNNIPEEFAEKLQNSMFQAKTTGSNFYGEWEEGKESRFAGLSKLIRELQKEYGGKGKEYSRKYETIVDFLAAPEKAKKEKQQREKQRIKDEKKRQKSNR